MDVVKKEIEQVQDPQKLQESLKQLGLTVRQSEALAFYASEKNDPPKWWIEKVTRRTGEDNYSKAWDLARADARAKGPAGKMNLAITLLHSTGMSTSWGGFRRPSAPSNN